MGCCGRGCWSSGKRRTVQRAHLTLNGIGSVIVLGNALYVWLRNAEFEVLSSDHALEVIAKWLDQIPLEEYESESNGGEEEPTQDDPAPEGAGALNGTLDAPPPLPEAVCAEEPPPASSRPMSTIS